MAPLGAQEIELKPNARSGASQEIELKCQQRGIVSGLFELKYNAYHRVSGKRELRVHAGFSGFPGPGSRHFLAVVALHFCAMHVANNVFLRNPGFAGNRPKSDSGSPGN